MELEFVTREGWGARNTLMDRDVVYLSPPVTRLCLIHTAWPVPEPSFANLTKCMREIQDEHQQRRGYADIGYHFLIGEDGTIFEGRGWKMQGAFIRAQNSDCYCFAFLGSFTLASGERPSQAAVDSVVRLINYALAKGHLDGQPIVFPYLINPAVIEDIERHRDAPRAQFLQAVLTTNVTFLEDTTSYHCVLDVPHIGRGTFGIVYAVHTLSTHKSGPVVNPFPGSLVVKVLQSDSSSVRNEQATMFDNLQRIKRTSHDNLVEIFVVGRSDGLNPFYPRDQICLLMEQCRESIQEYAQKHAQQHAPLSQDVILQFAKEIACGLEYLHGLQPRFIHRDIKGENIFLSNGNRAKIGDLDSYAVLEHSTTGSGLKLACGTLLHMSPEMLQLQIDAPQRPNVGARTDIWSWACTVLELFGNGELHYVDAQNQPWRIVPNLPQQRSYNEPIVAYQVNACIASGGHPNYSAGSYEGRMSDGFCEIIKRCLRIDARERPTAAELLHQMEEIA